MTATNERVESIQQIVENHLPPVVRSIEVKAPE